MNQTHEPNVDSMGVETLTLPHVPPRTSFGLLDEASKPADSVWMRALGIFVIGLVACLAVAGGWRKGYVLAPTDGLKLVAPWKTPGEDYRGANENLMDQTVQFVPWTIYTVERYRQGQIPLWNPDSQLGVPFLGNGQSAIFYPTIFLHWHLPETWSWVISAALRLFVAGLGVYLLAGRYGLRGVPRMLAGVAFMLCGFNVVWLNHPQMNVTPLLPWGVLMTEMLVERVALHRILGAALVFFVQFLGGHPASCIHLLVACFLVWGLRVFWADETRSASGAAKRVFSLLAVVASMVLGFALAAGQWLPLIEYARHSGATIVREQHLKAEPAIATDPRYLLGVLFPYTNGYPDGVGPFEMRIKTHLPNISELAPGFVGTIPLVLAIFAMVVLRRRRTVRVWTIIALIAVAIAIKFPGVDHVVRLIPGLNVAQNARLLVVAALALSILAGFGLEFLTRALREGITPVRLRKTLKWMAYTAAAVAVIGASILLIARKPILNYGYSIAEGKYKETDSHEHSLEYAKGQVDLVYSELLLTSARLLIPAAILGIGAFLLWRHGKAGRGLASSPWPWFGLAVVDLLAFAMPYNVGARKETYFPMNVAAVETLRGLPRHRVAGTFRTFMPETLAAYDLPDIRGYDALAPERYYKWWKHPGIGDLPDYAQGYLSRLDDFDSPAWGLLDFGYLVTGADQPAPPADKFTLIADEGAKIYQANSIRPRAWVVPRAQVYDTVDQVLDRVAKMDFNPDEVVLLDKQVAYDAKGLIEDENSDGSRSTDRESKFWDHIAHSTAAGKSSVSFAPTPAKEVERPEVIRLRVTGQGGGYLVLADSYFPGWTARVTGAGGAQDVPILPANGVMRAVPLPAGGGTVSIEMRYRPWSWRIGAGVSLGAGCLFVLLVGLSLIRGRDVV